jgi:phosphoglycerate kinase
MNYGEYDHPTSQRRWERLSLKTVKDLDVKGRKVLVRVDFNVPLTDQGDVADDTRIRAALPTIAYLLDQGAAVILMSHLGRPKGKVNDKLRLDGVAKRLESLLKKTVAKADDCVGPVAEAAAGKLQPGQVLLLENLRFHPEEEANDPAFAKQLASLADLYVNDAFGTAHRAHASTVAVAELLPSAAGFLMEKEVEMLGKILTNPERPFTAVLGGAKIADKIGVLEKLAEKVDHLLLGGGMANTFLLAGGSSMGSSLVDESHLDFARDFMTRAKSRGVAVELPLDLVVAPVSRDKTEVVAPGAVPDGWQALDIGPETVRRYEQVIAGSKTVFWNGPLGMFEQPAFAHGSEAIARAIASPGLVSVVGGGDSLALLDQAGVAGQVTHASTGGGASLEFLEGRELPGVAVLRR